MAKRTGGGGRGGGGNGCHQRRGRARTSASACLIPYCLLLVTCSVFFPDIIKDNSIKNLPWY